MRLNEAGLAELLISEIEERGNQDIFKMATVTWVYGNGEVDVRFDGEDRDAEKRYKYLRPYNPKRNDRVVLVSIKGSYLILGTTDGEGINFPEIPNIPPDLSQGGIVYGQLEFNREPVTSTNEVGYCGSGGEGGRQGQGVNFRLRKTYLPSTVQFSTLGSTIGELPSALNITRDGFFMYFNVTKTGYNFWRGTYSV